MDHERTALASSATTSDFSMLAIVKPWHGGLQEIMLVVAHRRGSTAVQIYFSRSTRGKDLPLIFPGGPMHPNSSGMALLVSYCGQPAPLPLVPTLAHRGSCCWLQLASPWQQ